ncbi:hypothetical protein AB2B38_008475 [Balneola sp. MJW-20]|uniref:hypothetical protein n=1 Tax=Gracilimonas aurantiaca TaxID=3234185 RepID=UPI003465A304
MFLNKMTIYICAFSLLLGLSLTGCDTASDNGNQTNLSLQFSTAGSSAKAISSSSFQATGDTLRVTGSNGTLVLTDIWFIVEDFELEKADGECEGIANEDYCEEVESDPFFVDLPLNAEIIDLGANPITAGLYEELEFEIDDLDLDEEEDPEEQQQKLELLNEVRAVFSDWPDSVSMVIIGEFESAQGGTTSFKAYAEAEVEIELEFNPPLEVSDNTVNKLVRININPADWFLRGDGTVTDLSQYDFENTGQILEFEAEIENGFKSVEVDDDDD